MAVAAVGVAAVVAVVVVMRDVAATAVLSANSVILVAVVSVVRAARVARARNSLFGDFCGDLRFAWLLVVSAPAGGGGGGGMFIVLVVVVGEFLGDSKNWWGYLKIYILSSNVDLICVNIYFTMLFNGWVRCEDFGYLMSLKRDVVVYYFKLTDRQMNYENKLHETLNLTPYKSHHQ